MFGDILSRKQEELLPLISEFKREFYLVGGTAIALHLRHRQSIDFDLFKTKPFNKKKLIDKITKHFKDFNVIYQESNQLHLIVNDVKLTFFEYGFEVEHKIKFDNVISLPALIDLAAMKAYALGRRAKWKDYVDLFFIFKNGYSLSQIQKKGNEIFGELFSIKMFKQQLCYFQDIDFSESVIYKDKPIKETDIKKYLTEIALTPF